MLLWKDFLAEAMGNGLDSIVVMWLMFCSISSILHDAPYTPVFAVKILDCEWQSLARPLPSTSTETKKRWSLPETLYEHIGMSVNMRSIFEASDA